MCVISSLTNKQMSSSKQFTAASPCNRPHAASFDASAGTRYHSGLCAEPAEGQKGFVQNSVKVQLCSRKTRITVLQHFWRKRAPCSPTLSVLCVCARTGAVAHPALGPLFQLGRCSAQSPARNSVPWLSAA